MFRYKKKLRVNTNNFGLNDFWKEQGTIPSYTEHSDFFGPVYLRPPSSGQQDDHVIKWHMDNMNKKGVPSAIHKELPSENAKYEADYVQGLKAKTLPAWYEIQGKNWHSATQRHLAAVEKYRKEAEDRGEKWPEAISRVDLFDQDSSMQSTNPLDWALSRLYADEKLDLKIEDTARLRDAVRDERFNRTIFSQMFPDDVQMRDEHFDEQRRRKHYYSTNEIRDLVDKYKGGKYSYRAATKAGKYIKKEY